MAKFSGMVGYLETVETEPGIWDDVITEKKYNGDVVRNISRMQPTNNVNDNITVNNNISIVADPFAYKNFQHMRYVIFMGNKWKISNVEIIHPRIVLSLGGLYNG